MSEQHLSQKSVEHALQQINQGEANAETFSTIVSAASAWAALNLVPEWGFDAPSQQGVKLVTTNSMMAEVMQAGRPEATLYFRYAPAWIERPQDTEGGHR